MSCLPHQGDETLASYLLAMELQSSTAALMVLGPGPISRTEVTTWLGQRPALERMTEGLRSLHVLSGFTAEILLYLMG